MSSHHFACRSNATGEYCNQKKYHYFNSKEPINKDINTETEDSELEIMLGQQYNRIPFFATELCVS